MTQVIPPALFTQQQLSDELGGDDKLLALVDKTNTGLLSSVDCQRRIAQIITKASGKVYSYAQISADVTDPNIITPFISSCAITAGVYWAWHFSTSGAAVPPDTKDAYAQAIEEMKEYAAGQRAVGATPTPNTSAGLENIDPDPCGVRTTRTTLRRAGFT